ncbi:uncharacterized protein LOC143071096 [Mytilus galloprovincialis]|uniref:uncharacterized protein LOC143071096 n=1 Tax=Mytilus galloprovincialis TaxID=29158 RepID=UPI003F7BD629
MKFILVLLVAFTILFVCDGQRGWWRRRWSGPTRRPICHAHPVHRSTTSMYWNCCYLWITEPVDENEITLTINFKQPIVELGVPGFITKRSVCSEKFFLTNTRPLHAGFNEVQYKAEYYEDEHHPIDGICNYRYSWRHQPSTISPTSERQGDRSTTVTSTENNRGRGSTLPSFTMTTTLPPTTTTPVLPTTTTVPQTTTTNVPPTTTTVLRTSTTTVPPTTTRTVLPTTTTFFPPTTTTRVLPTTTTSISSTTTTTTTVIPTTTTTVPPTTTTVPPTITTTVLTTKTTTVPTPPTTTVLTTTTTTIPPTTTVPPTTTTIPPTTTTVPTTTTTRKPPPPN